MKMNPNKQLSYAMKIHDHIKNHKVSLGLFLAAYGTFYLSSVIMSNWNILDIARKNSSLPPFAIGTLLSQDSIAAIFFASSFPMLFFGAIMLCYYCIKGLGMETVEDRERIGIILVSFGFFYITIGAWPLTKSTDFPWEWQKQIISNGVLFSWMLYILSIIVLVVGAVTVYRTSKIYHQKHPDFSLET